MNSNYDKVIDVLKNKSELEPVFEDLKKWYKSKGIEAYNFEIIKTLNDIKNPEYELYCYSNLNDVIDESVYSIINKFEKNAFIEFKKLCIKHNAYTTYKWSTELIFNKDFTAYIKRFYFNDFISNEFENIKDKYNLKTFKLGTFALFYFDSQSELIENLKNGNCNKIIALINQDFNEYIKSISYLKDLNINLNIEDWVTFDCSVISENS